MTLKEVAVGWGLGRSPSFHPGSRFPISLKQTCRDDPYFGGELLDIDGLTGGFNFQASWTTGWLAGRAMAAQTG